MTRPLAEQRMKAELLAKGLKLCTKCEDIKLVEEFGPRPKNSDGLECWCKACRREYQCQKRKNNPEQARARDKAYSQTPQYRAYIKRYREENEERLRVYRHQYYEENKEIILEQCREYYYGNRDQKCARAKVYRQEHKEERNEYNKEWRRKNPVKAKAFKQRYRTNNRARALELDRLCSIRRRAKKAEAEGTHIVDQWSQLLSFFNGICPRCGEEQELTQDHIIPLDWGGSNYLANLQPLCKSCNSIKKNFFAADYRPAYVRAWSHFQSYPQLEARHD